MKRFFIEEAKCGITNGGFACGPISGNVVVSIKFNDGVQTQWLSLVEVEGIPNVYLSDKDIYDSLMAEDVADEQFNEYLDEHFVENFNGIIFDEDYAPTFESMLADPENPAIPLIRYLIALVRCSMEDVENLIAIGTEKYADEVETPVTDVEEEFYEEFEGEGANDFSEKSVENDSRLVEDSLDTDNNVAGKLDKESVYRLRLFLETDVKTKSVFHDLDRSGFKSEKAMLKDLKETCDEEDYNSWKQAYIESQYELLKGKKFLVCEYMFVGLDSYEVVIAEEEKASFICWINGNGSAFFTGEREASEKEIKTYIALHADEKN